MDAFFASVEQRDFPKYRGIPISVGGSKSKGVVCAASYEARKFGVRAGMPSHQAYKLCPHIKFVPLRFQAYKEASNIVMGIFKEYTDLIEPMSLDEAYLDVTDCSIKKNSATLIAKEIRKKIYHQTKLTASAGISISKFLAKVASDYNKPNGLKLITPEEAPAFISTLPISKVPGIGKVSEKKFNENGIYVCQDILDIDKSELNRMFGKLGIYYKEILSLERIDPVVSSRIRKSYGKERTFSENLTDKNIMIDELTKIISMLVPDLEKYKILARTVTLKIKYFDFTVNTRSKTLEKYIYNKSDLFSTVLELLNLPIPPFKPVRLLGVSLSNLRTTEYLDLTEQLILEFE